MNDRGNEMTYIDLKKLERKAFTSYHGDGIMDIFAGMWILFFGLFNMCTDKPWFGAGMFPVYGLPFFLLAKKKITVPRIGYVEFNEQRRSLLFLIYIWIAAIFTVFGIVYYTENSPSWIYALLHDYPKVFFGIIVGLLFLVCAWVTRIIRFYLYALLIMAVMVIGHLFGPHIDYEYFPVVLGLIILSMGVLVLIQFIQTFPVEPEPSHVGGGCI
jgi:hypothetical protein